MKKPDLSYLKKLFPTTFTRKQAVELLKEHYPIKLTSSTMAKLDCKGEGVKNRMLSGRTVIYSRKYFIEFLENRTKIMN